MSELVTPFRIRASDDDLADLGVRLRHTRWPERETVRDWSQGVPLGCVSDWFIRATADAVTVPTGGTVFPAEVPRPSRRWAARRYTDIRYWGEPPRGGHFAALEQPGLFVSEVRSLFRLVR